MALKGSTSVVIPAYNGVQFIQAAIESIFVQTSLPQEIIIVDDASTDGTPDLVEQMAKDSPIPLRLIRLDQNSGGPARPMNIGVQAASAAFIALLDQDDVMLPCKISVLAGLLTTYEKAALAFGQYHCVKSGRTLQHPELYAHLPNEPCCIPEEVALASLLRHPLAYFYGGAGGTMIRRSSWLALGGFDESFRIVWDYDFAIRAAVAGGDAAYSACPVYLHRQHATNLETKDGGTLLSTEHCTMLQRTLRLRGLSDESRNAASRALIYESLALVRRFRNADCYGRALAYALLSIRHGGNTEQLWHAVAWAMFPLDEARFVSRFHPCRVFCSACRRVLVTAGSCIARVLRLTRRCMRFMRHWPWTTSQCREAAIKNR